MEEEPSDVKYHEHAFIFFPWEMQGYSLAHHEPGSTVHHPPCLIQRNVWKMKNLCEGDVPNTLYDGGSMRTRLLSIASANRPVTETSG